MKSKLLAVFLLTSLLINAQQVSSKRIKIYNPTTHDIQNLQKAGIDLRCGAIFENKNLKLELSSFDLKKLDKTNINYKVEINDLTKFYNKNAAKNLPKAKEKLAFEKLKIKTATRLSKTAKGQLLKGASISSVIQDIPLQYSGLNEKNWSVPQNFVYGSMGGCLTVSEVQAQLDLMRTKYPNLITVKADASTSNKRTYGYAGSNGWAGQTVYFVKISDNPDGPDDATEPDILYTSMIHSREVGALMNQMFFMWYLLENYATDPAVKSLVDNNEMFFIPVVNPDGLRWNEKIAPGGGGMQRKNLRANSLSNPQANSSFTTGSGVDLNRNFDYLWGSAGSGSSGTYSSSSYRGPSAASEPETQILVEFVNAHNFKTCLMHHTYANVIPHPYGGIPIKISGREDEMAKWHEDMTRYNRYISGAQVFTAANGIADDWMVGGTTDGNGSVGSGHQILATTPESGHSTEGGFWPSSNTNILKIVKRAMRINFMNAYYGGKYAKLSDLTQNDFQTLTSNLTFGLERVGQTNTNFTVTVTPISTNIQSIAIIPAQTAMAILEHRKVNTQIILNSSIMPNDKIEYKVSLKNSDFTFYEANYVKYYQPNLLLNDNPDANGLTNWISSGSWVTTTADKYSGTTAIKNSVTVPYANNQNVTLTTANSYNLSSSDKVIVQFYTKWDIERNYDFVELLGSTDGITWQSIHGIYDKPEAKSVTNDGRGYDFTKTASFQSSNSAGRVYDGDEMDKWVMEEIVIDASNNSYLFNSPTVKFRFHFRTDGNNKPENYSTTYDGFYFDDFKIISVTLGSPLGIEDEILNAFQIYPNPSKNQVNISLPNSIPKAMVTISNTLGQKIYSKIVNMVYKNIHTINTNSFKTGIYFVTVNTDKGKVTKKLIIQ